MGKKNKNFNVKKLDTVSKSENDEIINMIKVLGSVVLVLVAFYFVFAIYNGEISFGEEKEKEKVVEIQNTEILAGSTFNRPNGEYYVLMFDFDGTNSIKCQTVYNLYLQKKDAIKMYLVDLGNAFNSSYVVNARENVNVSNAETLRVMEPTLLKIKDGIVEKSVFGIDELNNYQETLLK